MSRLEAENKYKRPKVKKTYSFNPEIAELIDSHKYVKTGREIDFVSQAIRNYCAEIDGARNLDVLCDRMYKIISAEVDSQSNRLANILFKIAVEMAIQNNMLAAGYVNLTEAEMRSIRNQAMNKVRKSHGFLSFEKALEEERALSEG